MNETLHPALLPLGFADLLPPLARIEASVVARLVAALESHGYERVKPPLIEFEDNMLSGAGAAMARETFRLMDPISQRMIALRADVTTQVARIAATRLAKAPRPLRLSYAGQVLRARGSEIRPERQVGQVGAELIGSDSVAADVEVISIAAEALQILGIADLSVDLTLPTLVPAVTAALGVAETARDRLRAALDHKDVAAVAAVGGGAAEILRKLIASAGAAETALAALDALPMPSPADAERARLREVVTALYGALPSLRVTVDPVENRGFEYHTGISFSFFARGSRVELGRGGRYRTGNGEGENATGVTLYSDTILRVLPEQSAPRRLYLPWGTGPNEARRLREEGWITVAGLAPVPDAAAEALRLDCGHRLEGGKIVGSARS
ncbi:MAG TPA: ATP phosphoribosyltransferase regulatory subunit [Stellaceae bacterium]|nr:ATP phosphoribosyltransferase regulatory subunit [Stellaceae bacterium]